MELVITEIEQGYMEGAEPRWGEGGNTILL